MTEPAIQHNHPPPLDCPGCVAMMDGLRAWSLALQSLTPSGSEFADDPERCAAFVREVRDGQHQAIIDLTRRARAAEKMAQVHGLVAGAVVMSAMATPDEKDGHIARLQVEKEDVIARADEAEARASKYSSEAQQNWNDLRLFEPRLRTAEAKLSALREYAQHKAECAIYKCCYCGMLSRYVSHTTDIPYGIMPYAEGPHAFKSRDCDCGLAALEATP